jgi:CID domain
MSLHEILAQIDMTHPRITAGAAAMMKHYDRSAETAVTEWRNALQSCREEQLLPLLYVANETLQNSKRNRGNNFLEAFSTTLGQSLHYICQRSPALVEKVRRTAKIWGDRRVFSVRFVGELLKGLESFRNDVQQQRAPPVESPVNRFSPEPSDDDNDDDDHDDEPRMETPKSNSLKSPTSPRTEVTVSPTAEDLMRESSDDDDDDQSLGFGSGVAALNVTFDASKLGEMVVPKAKRPVIKRRRSSSGKKRRAILSTQSLQELWNQLSVLQQQYDQSQTLLRGISEEHLRHDNVSDLIGDEILDAYNKNVNYIRLVQTERINLLKVANGKHSLEQEAVRYLPWCNSALLQDEEELELCDAVEQDLLLLQTVHAAAKQVRDERRALQEEEERRHALEKQRQEEEEERKRLLEASLAKQEEAKPGMVWNKATLEYQYLNTDESWRD